MHVLISERGSIDGAVPVVDNRKEMIDDGVWKMFSGEREQPSTIIPVIDLGGIACSTPSTASDLVESSEFSFFSGGCKPLAQSHQMSWG